MNNRFTVDEDRDDHFEATAARGNTSGHWANVTFNCNAPDSLQLQLAWGRSAGDHHKKSYSDSSNINIEGEDFDRLLDLLLKMRQYRESDIA